MGVSQKMERPWDCCLSVSASHAEDNVGAARGRLDGREGIQHSSSPFPPVPCPQSRPQLPALGKSPSLDQTCPRSLNLRT
ncbi:rCG45708 [Rattus norvegicus]|uniref:RCG45708 n=1 Tax=Rattus norvegicus TaxID=10116 RepID=A6JU93_RAT|nr:rCG45708 [Rattus norvegicus]